LLLKNELEAVGCKLNGAEFNAKLEDLFAETHPNETADDLRCQWRQSRDFCRLVRSRAKLPETCDELVLRALDNIRRDGRLNLGDKPRRAARMMKAWLEQVGCPIGPDEFLEVIRGAFNDLFENWTVDHLLNRWADAGHYCSVVRHQSGFPECPDDLILRSLLNTRKKKKGKLSLAARSK
jgi:hypothetical protein